MEPLPSLTLSTQRETDLEHIEYATAKTREMLGYYRKGEANDPARYGLAIAKTLSGYSKEVINEITSPTTGLPSRTDFMPTLKEVRAACELEASRLNKIANYGSLKAVSTEPPPKIPHEQSYQACLDSLKRPLGRWEVPGDTWNRNLR